MSDDDYDDELPPIAVNGSDADACGWSMPDAGAVAAERAAAAARELAVKALRERAREEEAALAQGTSVVFLDQTSSSSSEGEGLTATLDALRVCATPIPNYKGCKTTLPSSPAVIEDLLNKYAECLAKGGRQLLELKHELWLAILGCVQSQEPMDDKMVLACVCVCLYSRQHRHTQLLRRILDYVATDSQIQNITSELLTCMTEPAQLIACSDAFRSGCLQAGDSVADTLICVAVRRLTKQSKDLTELTADELTSLLQSRWRGLAIPSQYCLLQCVGRLLAHRLRDHADHVIDTLEALTNNQGFRGPAPDKLTVMVAASKLQLLFRNKR